MDTFFGFIVGSIACLAAWAHTESQNVDRGWFEHKDKFYQITEIDPPYSGGAQQ